MKIEITARHFTPSDDLKKMVHLKVAKIFKFNASIISCHVVLNKESHAEKVEIILHLKGRDFISVESTDCFEKSLILVVDKIITRVKKQHDKSIKH